MAKQIAGTRIAVLVANGFDEANFLAAQRFMQESGATMRVISSNQGLVNGWNGSEWGHNYAVDESLSTSLGVDFDALIIPGGQRSNEKLKLTAHTRRFIGSFMAAQKPVAVMGDALNLMALTNQIMERRVTGPSQCQSVAIEGGAQWMNGEGMVQDDNLLTSTCDNKEMMRDYFSTFLGLFMQYGPSFKEAA